MAPAPNYAARRMLVTAGVITAAAVGTAAVWDLVHGGDSLPPARPATWDAVAIVARASGDVTLVGRGGAVEAEYAALGRNSRVEVSGSHLALIGTSQVTLLDTADESAESTVVPIERGTTVTRLATDREHLLLAVGDDDGGEVTLIDGITGWNAALGEVAGLSAPRLFTDTIRIDPTGSVIAIADAASFQTIVVDRGDDPNAEPTVTNYAAQPLAVGERVVVTSQVVGQRADIGVYTGDATSATPVSTGILAGGVVADDALLAVTTDGSVVKIRRGDRQPRQIATLDLPEGSTATAVHPMLEGTRLAVVGDGYTAVIGTDGEVLYESAHGPSDAQLPAPGFEQRCLVAGAGTDAAELVDAADGTVLADLAGTVVVGASADGCVAVGSDGSTVRAYPGDGADPGTPAAEVILVAPDAAAVVATSSDRTTTPTTEPANTSSGAATSTPATGAAPSSTARTLLITLGDDTEPVDLSALVPGPAVTFAFVQR